MTPETLYQPLNSIRTEYRLRMNRSADLAAKFAAEDDMQSVSEHSTESERCREAFQAMNRAIFAVDEYYAALSAQQREPVVRDFSTAEPSTSEADYVICKRGHFYRPDAAGYTSNIHEAGRWTKSQAEKYAVGVEGVTIHLASEFEQPEAIAAVSVDELAQIIERAVIDDCKTKPGSAWLDGLQAASRALLARFRIERLDRLASGRQ